MRETELLDKLRSTSKPFFTVADLEKITGLDRSSLHVSLNRWVKKGILDRVSRNTYVLSKEPVDPEAIAGQIYFPSYLSFESALSQSGILNLIPHALTFATTRKTKTLTMLGRVVVYRHINDSLFFGFNLVERLYVAEPEKALLDLIYFSTFGKASVPAGELDLKPLSKEKVEKYAERFPKRVSEAVARLWR